MFDDNEEISNNPFCETNECTEEELKNELETVLEGNIESLRKELDDAGNKYVRLLADFDNFRKRQAQERENLLKYGAEETLKKIIPSLDTLERAKKSLEEIEDCATVKESYEIAFKQLVDNLQKCGLEIIETENKEFDPNLHDAVVQTPTNDVEEHTIIAQLQTGYKIGDLVLRPALVNVAVAANDGE